MKKAEFKPGQQWLSRDGKHKFHILSTNEYGEPFCVCVGGERLLGCKITFYSSGHYFYMYEDQYDLVTLVKDVE